ncbi:hypothetical protein PMAYCL1PPCAC_17904 [Pristionchus mayeri]|uniref:G protein-coupled receptor n=1 Tax=Pristionchus mayeri TaxID=1317129 RepID=A0AAN5CNW1_9BILA|nr:hypothetical protein PMAYCL1PPCAC_17904 [Pristionchus mayeri]
MSRKDLSSMLSVVLLDEDSPLESYYNRICLVGRCIGLNFDSSNLFLRIISYLVTYSIVCIGLYFVCSVGCSIFFLSSSPHIAVSITIFIFNLQAVISIMFLIYWQKRGAIHKFIQLLKEPQNGDGVNRYRAALLGQMMAALSMTLLVLLYISSLFAVYLSGKNITVIDREIIHSFGSRSAYIIPLTAQEYAFFGWNLSILIYVFCVEVTFYEIRYFNRSIRTINGTTEESLCSQISNAIKKYSDIAVAVRSLDKIFKRFAFMMIACSIPSLLFCLYVVFSRLNSDMEEKVIMMPALLYLLYSFFSLTAVPAKLHDEITKTKSAFYENTHIWFPYRSPVYNAAVAFCSHLEQSNLGISIWGFALLSRPLILTVLEGGEGGGGLLADSLRHGHLSRSPSAVQGIQNRKQRLHLRLFQTLSLNFSRFNM